MRKKLFSILIIISLVFIGVSSVNAEASKFSSEIEYEYDIDNRKITLILGFSGEPTYKVDNVIIYDDKYIELDDSVTQEDFTMLESKEEKNGTEHELYFSCESESIYDEANYLLLVFNMKSDFKVGKSSYITIKDIVGYGEDFKYRDPGKYVIIRRENPLELTIIPKTYNKNIKFRLWMEEHLVWICFGLLGLILSVIFIFIPSIQRIENKDKKIRKQISKDYMLSKNIKKIDLHKPREENTKVIPEETLEDFNPFKDNVSKTSTDKLNTSDELQNVVDAFELKKKVAADFSNIFEEIEDESDSTNAVNADTDTITNTSVEKARKTAVIHKNDENDLVLFNPVNLESTDENVDEEI